jgi:hypothetical protein
VPKHQPLGAALPEVTAKGRPVAADGEPEGQASYEMANLRPERTGLPFVVFISQKAARGTTCGSKSHMARRSGRKW